MKYILIILIICTACSNQSFDNTKFNNNNIISITQPENLLEISSERSAFSVANYQELNRFNSQLSKQLPDYAQVMCLQTDQYCLKAKNTLISNNIIIKETSTEHLKPIIILVYSRVSLKDKKKQLLAHHHGHAVANNIIKMIDNPNQFLGTRSLDHVNASELTNK